MDGRLMRHRPRGSALTEFVVLLIVMLPLLFGIPMIGKLIDLRQTGVQASRYAAWETTVHDDGRAPDDVQSRFFADEGAPLVSTPVAAETNRLWGSGRDGDALANSLPMDTRVSIDESLASAVPYADAYTGEVGHGPAHAMGELVEDVGGLLDGFSGGRWDIEPNGLLKGGVSVQVEDNGWLADIESFSESSVIMNDGWSAPDDEAAAKRVRSFVPMGALEEHHIETLLVSAGLLPPFKELRQLDGAFGKVDMNPLPESEQGLRAWEEHR